MSNIERSQRAFMAEAEQDAQEKQPGIDWLTVAIYTSSACFSVCVIAGSAVFLRWLVG